MSPHPEGYSTVLDAEKDEITGKLMLCERQFAYMSRQLEQNWGYLTCIPIFAAAAATYRVELLVTSASYHHVVISIHKLRHNVLQLPNLVATKGKAGVAVLTFHPDGNTQV